MKIAKCLLIALACLSAPSTPGQVAPVVPPAFPGAQGGGALSLGGRGGTVYLVTNVNNSGDGSLRTCVEASGPRVCVFRTGGRISLLGPLIIANPYITIAGQTAPGGGIQITGPTGQYAPGNPALMITTHDVVVQDLRVRRGHNAGEICNAMPWSCGASVEVFSNSPATDPSNIMIDHVSAEWSNYEAILALGCDPQQPGCASSIPYEPRLATVSRSIIGESLAGAGQTTGVEFGGYSGRGSYAPDLMTDLDFHHNLFAGFSHRMPLLTVKSGRLVSNIVYAWTYYPVRNKGFRDIINNLFLTRTGQTAASHEIQAWTEDAGNDTSFPPSFYVVGNVGPHDLNGTSNWNNMTALAINESSGDENCPSPPSCPLNTMYQRNSAIPIPGAYVLISADPASSLQSILLNTGRTSPYDGVGACRQLDCSGRWVDNQDAVDIRIVNAVANRTNLYRNYDYSNLQYSPQSQADLGGFPSPDPGTPCVDVNNNGMPDGWEAYWAAQFGHGNTLDPNGQDFRDGYSNLEHYIQGMSPSP
jgi:hypothetical protein